MLLTMGFQNPTLVGNVLSIPPGTYNGAFMTEKVYDGPDKTPFDGPLIIDAQGATFTGTIFLPSTLKDVDFINFNFSGVKNECFRWANDQVQEGLVNVRFLNISTTDCDSFCLIGSWLDITQQTSMSRNIEVGNIVINRAKTNSVLFFCKSFGLKVHDVTVNGAGNPQIDAESHQGIVFIRWSDGEFYNNKITEGGGNGFRVFPAGNPGRGTISIHDNYVANMRKHSAVESNGFQTPDGFSADIHIFNNTFGNLAPADYQSGGVAMYAEKTSKTFITRNVVFNTSKGVIFSGDGTLPDEDNDNFYYSDAQQAGVDLVTGKLSFSSPVYGKAGAWMASSPSTNIPPVAQAGPDQTVYLPSDYVLLYPAGSIDNKIVSYLWEQSSGPVCKLLNQPSPFTGFAVVKDLVEGVYQFKLTVTDNLGASGSGTKTVIVKKPPTIVGVSIKYDDGSIREI